MAYSLPVWFQADEVFTHNGNWYLGSVGSLHIGPYGDRESAEIKAIVLAKKLRSMDTDASQLRYVRRLLREEWKEIGMAGSDGETCLSEEIELTTPPVPVRSGEKPKNWFRSQLVALLRKELTDEEARKTVYEYKHRPPR